MVYRKVRKYDRKTLRYRRPERGSFMGARWTSEAQRGSVSSFSLNNGLEESGSIRNFGRENSAEFSFSPDLNLGGDEDNADQEGSRRRLAALVKQWKSRRQTFAEDNPRTQEVFQQAVAYLVVFYLTHVWSTTNRIIQQLRNGRTYFGVICLHSLFDPLQGFLNYLVYQRPRYVRCRKEHPKIGRLGAFVRVLRFSCMPELEVRQATGVDHDSDSARNNNEMPTIKEVVAENEDPSQDHMNGDSSVVSEMSIDEMSEELSKKHANPQSDESSEPVVKDSTSQGDGDEDESSDGNVVSRDAEGSISDCDRDL